MLFQLTPISLAIFFATGINGFVAYKAWQRRTARSGRYFALGMLAATFWTLAAALDYAAVPLSLKVFFAKLEYLGHASALSCFTAFALSYAGHEDWLKKPWVKGLLLGIPVITILLAWTNELHGWVWASFTPNDLAENVVIFEHGPVFPWIALVGYGLVLIIFANLLTVALRSTGRARQQARLLLWALGALVVSNLLYLFDAFNIPGVDWSSILFSITGLLFLYALYGFRLMDIVPIARNTLIERMTDGVLVLDKRGNLVDFNPAAQAILGLRSADVWTRAATALAHWPDISALLQSPIEPLATEVTLGQPAKTFDLQLTVLVDQRNEVYGQLVVMRDITIRKQAEVEREAALEALHVSEARAQATLRAIPDLMFRLDRQGVYLDYKAEMSQLYAQAEPTLIGRRNRDLTPPDFADLVDRQIRTTLETGALQTFEYQLPIPGRGPGTYEARMTVSGVDEVIVIVRDITDRKQAEAALRSSEALYRQVFAGHSAIMLLIDPESRAIIQANPAAAEFYGYPLADLQQMNLQQIVMDLSPEELEQRSQRVLRGEEVYFTAPHQLASGKVREVEVHSTPIQLEGRILLYSIIHDVTRRKQAEEALHQRNQVLAALQQVMLDLINRHDVKDILEALLIKLGVPVNAPHISVGLLENQDTLTIVAATPGQPLREGDIVRRGAPPRGADAWLSWQAIDTGEPVRSDADSGEQGPALHASFTIPASLIVPIKHGARVIGAIYLLRTESYQPFTATDVYAAEQLAQVVAVVMDNAQLVAQLRAELAERQRVEEELRVLSRTVEQSQMAVMITTTTGAIQYVNSAFSKMSGYRLEEVRGQNPRFLQADHTPSEVYRDLWNTILAGRDWHGEFHNRKKTGELYWDATLIFPIVNEQGTITHFVAMKEDVTERKHVADTVLKMAAFEERQRMARDLHDSVNQSIHSLVLFAETLVVVLDRQQLDRTRYLAARLQESARQALKETRLLLYQFRSSLAEGFDLIQNLETRLATVERYAGVEARLTYAGSPDLLPPDWAENLFWIAVEALNNALKHAQARHLLITLRCEPHLVELEVADDGRGFDSAKIPAGRLGLINQQKRAALLGGKLEIISSPGQGCRVYFSAEVKAPL